MLIKNARAVTFDSIQMMDIGIRDGKYVGFYECGSSPEADTVIDAEGKYVFPGIIDCHAHFEDPGWTYREDFATGTKAAAAGGLTTIIDMPLDNDPAPVDPSGLEAKKAIIADKAYVDYGLYGAVCGYNKDDLVPLTKQGIACFKGFIRPRSSMTVGPFNGVESGEVRDALYALKGSGGVCCFHCEDDPMVTYDMKRLKENGTGTYQDFLDAHTVLSEVLSVMQAVEIARDTGGKLHICHVSHPKVAEVVKKAIQDGVDVSAETCPHYLGFSEDIFEEKGILAKGTPPIRDREAMEKLWDYVLDGTLSCIGSDHSPAAIEEKDPEKTTIWTAWGGMNSIQVFVARMFDLAVSKRGLSPELIARTMCYEPARRFGLYGKKGDFKIGFDGDIVIIDPEKEWTCSNDELYTMHHNSVYDGISGKGAPVVTIVRGKVVAQDGEVIGEQGYGNFIFSDGTAK